MCLPVQTRADAQGNVYTVTINTEGEREMRNVIEVSDVINIPDFFFLFNGTNVSLTCSSLCLDEASICKSQVYQRSKKVDQDYDNHAVME